MRTSTRWPLARSCTAFAALPVLKPAGSLPVKPSPTTSSVVRSVTTLGGAGGVLARFGGDEFAILDEGLPDCDDGTKPAEQICDACWSPCTSSVPRRCASLPATAAPSRRDRDRLTSPRPTSVTELLPAPVPAMVEAART